MTYVMLVVDRLHMAEENHTQRRCFTDLLVSMSHQLFSEEMEVSLSFYLVVSPITCQDRSILNI